MRTLQWHAAAAREQATPGGMTDSCSHAPFPPLAATATRSPRTNSPWSTIVRCTSSSKHDRKHGLQMLAPFFGRRSMARATPHTSQVLGMKELPLQFRLLLTGAPQHFLLKEHGGSCAEELLCRLPRDVQQSPSSIHVRVMVQCSWLWTGELWDVRSPCGVVGQAFALACLRDSHIGLWMSSVQRPQPCLHCLINEKCE
jgi:hypothetical protein